FRAVPGQFQRRSRAVRRLTLAGGWNLGKRGSRFALNPAPCLPSRSSKFLPICTIHAVPTAVLSLVALGLLMGRKSLSSIARGSRLYGAPLAHALGLRRGKTPTKSMFPELLRALGPDASEATLRR